MTSDLSGRASGASGWPSQGVVRLRGVVVCWLREIPGHASDLVELPAPPADAGGREADQIFVTATEPDVDAFAVQDPEQLVAARATPSVFHRTSFPRHGRK